MAFTTEAQNHEIMGSLDIEDFGAAADYLARRGVSEGRGTPAFQNLAGGVSNRTVRVTFPDGSAWVLKQALPKLRVAVDWFSDPERIHREALALEWYARLAPPGSVPRLLFEDREQHLLAMEAVPFPHRNWKSDLLSGRLDLGYFEQFGAMLGFIHRRAAAHLELTGVFADTSFFESLRLEPYYLYSAGQVPEAADFLHQLVADTRARRVTLVHGDYSPKNILIHDGRLVLLDYEVAHFGDPAFDLGFSLSHFCSKAHHLPDRRSDFAYAAGLYWGTYCATLEDSGDTPAGVPWLGDLEPRAVRHTLGCLLARVAGRSPLEYLGAGEQARQRAAVISLMADPPTSVPSVISEFLARLESWHGR
ncbi:MAG TPA: aminoglycoside phosphotransferase family protein [Terriglobia bacterium]|nr:aminoglycoside phosphotransferase family protein [Terriglobia bacterium]